MVILSKQLKLSLIYIIFPLIFCIISFNRFFINNLFFIILSLFSLLLIVLVGIKKSSIRNLRPALILILLCFFSVIWSVDPKATFYSSLYLFVSFLLSLSLLNVLNNSERINTLLIFAFLISTINIFAIVFFNNMTTDFDFRYGTVYKGLFNQKNGFGKYMGLAIIIASWGLLYKKNLKWKIINSITIVEATVCLILSKNFASIGTIFCIASLLILFKKYPIKYILWLFFFSIISAIWITINPCE